jgi:hypothetical protein
MDKHNLAARILYIRESSSMRNYHDLLGILGEYPKVGSKGMAL